LKTATAKLKKDYYTSSQSLIALLQILCNHNDKSLKQLAAVEARKLVPKHWPNIPNEQGGQIRTAVLKAMLDEEEKQVRHSGARVVSAIALIDLKDGSWPDLPKILSEAATSSNVRHREVGLFIIYAILETMGNYLTDELGNLFQLLGKTIQDPESIEVRVNTMLALGTIAEELDPSEDPASAEAFQDAIPNMLMVLKDAVTNNREEYAMMAFEVFQTLLNCDSALLQKHFANIVRFMLELACTVDLDDDYRTQALSFLMQCVRFRKYKVQSLRIGEEMTVKALRIVTELGDDIGDDDDVTPARSALGLLDILSASLPTNQVLVPLLAAVKPYVESNNPVERQAGIFALGFCVEGAPDFIATQLDDILPMVLRLLQDSDVRVRAAALKTVARLSDDLADEMGAHHEQLLPALVKNFDLAVENTHGPDGEQNLDIVRASCNAIDSLMEGLEKPAAGAYLQELMPRLSRLFQAEDYKAQAAAIGATGSLAASCEEAFTPYFQDTMQALGPYMRKKESEEELDLRGVVTDTMGKIGAAVGPQAFIPYVADLMSLSEEALHLGNPRLRESTYILWSTLAKIYQENFAEYISGVVKGLHECLKQEETDFEVELGPEAKDLVGKEVTIQGQKVKVAAAADDDDDEFEDIDDAEFEDFDAITAVAMEKEIALEVMGDLIASTRGTFLPFLEDTVTLVFSLLDSMGYEGVRRAAITTLWRTYGICYELAESQGMEKWTPGIPLKVAPSADLTKLGRAIMEKTLPVWHEEMDRYVGNLLQ
jgi:importin-4